MGVDPNRPVNHLFEMDPLLSDSLREPFHRPDDGMEPLVETNLEELTADSLSGFRRLIIDLPKAEYDRIEFRADWDGISVEEFVQQMIRVGVRRRPPT